jgi:REP element-mobilizing transposase RayT
MGQMAEGYPPVAFDAWVLMPNHLYAIVRLPGTEVRLGDLVQGFKGLTTARYAEGVHAGRWEPFDGRLWQRNYDDHIVHAQADLNRGRRYIRTNPVTWASHVDREPDMPMLLRACNIPRPPAD